MPACAAAWPFDACSYGGHCNTSLGICQCDAAFLSRGDLLPWEGRDCVVPGVLLTNIYAISLLVAIFNLIRRGSGLWRLLRLTQTRRLASQVNFPGHAKVLRLHSLGLAFCIAQLIDCIIFLLLHDEIVGENFTKTASHVVTAFLCYVSIFESCSFIAESTAELVASSLRLSLPRMHWFVRTSRPPFIVIVFISAVIPPFGSYFVGSHEHCLYLHLIGIELVFAYLSGLVYLSTTKLVEALKPQPGIPPLDNTLFSRKAEELRLKVAFVRRGGMFQTLMYIVLHGLLIVWPWARGFVPLEVALFLAGGGFGECFLFVLVDARTSKPSPRTSLRKIIDVMTPSRGSTSACSVLQNSDTQVSTS